MMAPFFFDSAGKYEPTGADFGVQGATTLQLKATFQVRAHCSRQRLPKQ